MTCAPIPLHLLKMMWPLCGGPLRELAGPVVLVGHAYAGSVIAAVHDDRVNSLVYIAALAPDEGETVADVFTRNPSHPNAPQMVPDVHGLVWMPEDGFIRAVAHNASRTNQSSWQRFSGHSRVKCIQEKVPAPAWKTKPSWFLLAERTA